MGEKNVQTVQQMYAAFGSGDIDALFDLMAPDIEWIAPGNKDVMPWAGNYRGKEQVKDFFPALAESVDFEIFEPLEIIPHGDERVVVLGRERFSAKVTGKKVEFEWVHVYTIRGGKVASFKIYEDTAPIEAAFRK